MDISLAILNSCKKGDEEAYQMLYELSIPYVYSIVKRYISKEYERKDIIQEVFAKVFININTFDRDKGKFKHWIRKIAVNECLMNLRSVSKLNIVTLNSDFDIIDHEVLANLELTRKDILHLLDKMPERYKFVFMAYVIDGFNHKEIAKDLNITPETSRSQLSRAKGWIRQNIIRENKIKSYGLF